VYADGSDPGILLSSPIRTKADARRKRNSRISAAMQQKWDMRRLDEKVTGSIRQVTEGDAISEFMLKLARKEVPFTFASLLWHVFSNCEDGGAERSWRWDHVFSVDSLLLDILDFLDSSGVPKSVRKQVREWATSVTLRRADAEAKKVTESGMLRVDRRRIGSAFIRDFRIKDLHANIERKCPMIFAFLRKIITAPRQLRECTKKTLDRKETVRIPRTI
jgi:hypothetical protein